MPITIHFPAMLHAVAGHSLVIEEPVGTVGELLGALERRVPGLGRTLDDPLYNLAVNDEMLLHRVAERPLADGDVVEVIPTISGGCADFTTS